MRLTPLARRRRARVRAWRVTRRARAAGELEVRWTWTNWTLGVWWSRRHFRAAGIDLGPFEAVYRPYATRGPR